MLNYLNCWERDIIQKDHLKATLYHGTVEDLILVLPMFLIHTFVAINKVECKIKGSRKHKPFMRIMDRTSYETQEARFSNIPLA